jgi:ABC-type transporter Mla maintaining outer membrane lipid asymmetry ATPase subunit MlaF
MSLHEVSSTNEPAVRISNLTVDFGDFVVIDDVSLDIPAGQCTIIMGQSGSGKSTLLKAAAGLIPGDLGRVEILGVDLDNTNERALLEIRRRNGFVFQDAALWQNMSIYRNLALPVEYHYPQIDQTAIRRKVESLTTRLAFTDELTLRPAQLSAGEQKTLSFLRALMTDPDLLFLDEPTGSVDSKGVDAMTAELRRLKRKGCTIVAVTHDARIASQLADYLVVIREGRVIDAGPIRTVVSSADPDVRTVLAEVLSETAVYDTDLLGLLEIDE